MTVKTVIYHALEPGKTLSVVGAVHGNERCGAQAIAQLIAGLDSGAVVLKRGTLQLMPVANPGAYAQGVRFVERNLNRYLYAKETKNHYEDYLDPILCAFLDRTDVLLDLHSYTASEGGAFVFLGGVHPDEIDYARALGVRDFVYGWAEAYGGGGKGGDKESQGTTEYARSKGALAATLECGQHQNADASDVGYWAILRALLHFDMLEHGCAAASLLKEHAGTALASQRCVKMKSVFYRDQDAVLAKPWRHFDFVAKGEPLAVLPGGGILAAPEDGHIILPKTTVATGDEWFYFGMQVPFPQSAR
jgi:predicted deacylase